MICAVIFKGKKITFYGCKDCKMVGDRAVTNRPNNKFCDVLCKEYVDSKKEADHD